MSGICLNEDNSNFFMSVAPQNLNREYVEAFAAGYATGEVQRVLWCPNSQRASFGSKTIEACWEGVDKDADGRLRFRGQYLSPNIESWIRNTQILHEKGINPYEVWLTKTRECGREAWLSCRMNDLHNVNKVDDVLHAEFWRENPDFWRAPYSGDWFGRALDFSFSEVRDYKLAYLQELLERFDLDGLELDWLRFPAYLKPGYELDDASLITDFMREVRKLTRAASERWHHAVALSVRLPGRPEFARRLGFDFLTWAHEDLMDDVTVSNFWPTTDSDMPLELWRGLLGTNITLNAGLEIFAKAYPSAPGMTNTLEIIAGFASQYLHRGADHIYLFNHMYGLTGMHDDESFKAVLANIGEESTVYPLTRRHVQTYVVPEALGLETVAALPKTPSTYWQSFRINVGGGTSSRLGYAVFGFGGEATENLEVRVNGEACTELEPCELSMPENVVASCQYRLPNRVLHDGDNVIEFRLTDGEASPVVWFEIYLP